MCFRKEFPARAWVRFACGATLAAAACAASAETILEIENSILVDALGGSERSAGGVITNPGPFLAFDETRQTDSAGSRPLASALANLDTVSSINGNRMLFEAAGGAAVVIDNESNGYSFATADANSRYAVTFSVDERRSFDLTGSISGDMDATALLTLSGPGVDYELFQDFSAVGAPEDFRITTSGVLDAGIYEFVVHTIATGNITFRSFDEGDVSFDVNLKVAPVPLPAALPMLAAAMVSVFACRRRRDARRTTRR